MSCFCLPLACGLSRFATLSFHVQVLDTDSCHESVMRVDTTSLKSVSRLEHERLRVAKREQADAKAATEATQSGLRDVPSENE